MKVLQIANYREGAGGISSQVELLARNLLREGIESRIFSTKGNGFKRLITPFSLLLKGIGYDIFHIHTCSNRGFFPAVVGVMIGQILRKRLLVTYHGGDAAEFFDKHEKLVKSILLKTDINIVLSGFIGNVFRNHGLPYTIIPNILEFNPTFFRERPSLQPRFISIRALRPLYNIPCILKAFMIVKSQRPDASLTIVGDGISRNELETFVSVHSIEGVTFTGRVDNSKIPELLDRADIMLSAPRTDNMPVSVLEGFNSGLLVISSNVGGVPYMIDDGVNGLLYNYDDYEELAEKMIYACSHQKEAYAMIATAYAGLKEYSWQSIRDKYLKLCQI